MCMLTFNGDGEGKVLGWTVGCRSWEKMVVKEERKKLSLSRRPELAPGSFSTAVLVENDFFFFFLSWIHMFILKKWEKIPFLLPNC